MKIESKWLRSIALGAAMALAVTGGYALASDQGDAVAAPGAGGEYGFMGMMGPNAAGLREQLGLTEDQWKQWRALRAEAMRANIRARSELRLKRLDLLELMQAEEPDRAAIEQKLRELSEARHLLTKQRVEHRLAVHELLTPEQRAKLQTLRGRHLRRSFGQRWQGRRPMRGRRGRGPAGGFGPCFPSEVGPPAPPE